MEYTKGKWEAEHIGNEGKYVIHTGDLSLPFVHTFPNRYRKPQVSSEEARTNARLIASAPDLYEALKGLLEWAKLSFSNDTGAWADENDPAIKEATQAIAKVEGKL